MDTAGLRQEFDRTGRLWFRGGLGEEELAILDAAAGLETRPGERLALSPELEAVLGGGGLGRLMAPLATDLLPARIVAFNKTPAGNWSVPWHQDRVIAMADRHDMPGFGNWTRKSGTWHCEPPAVLLEQMYFTRIHLDDSTAEDGGMRIAPGSHRLGVVPAAEAATLAGRFPQEDCTARRGDVLVLKMLTLHASAPSQSLRPRRVFRVDLAPPGLLPAPLRWS